MSAAEGSRLLSFAGFRLFGVEGTKAFWTVLLLLGAGLGLGIVLSPSSSSSDTATATPPLLPSPAPPPPLPSVSAVSFSIRMAGDLSSFTADVIGELEAAVATRAARQVVARQVGGRRSTTCRPLLQLVRNKQRQYTTND